MDYNSDNKFVVTLENNNSLTHATPYFLSKEDYNIEILVPSLSSHGKNKKSISSNHQHKSIFDSDYFSTPGRSDGRPSTSPSKKPIPTSPTK